MIVSVESLVQVREEIVKQIMQHEDFSHVSKEQVVLEPVFVRKELTYSTTSRTILKVAH